MEKYTDQLAKPLGDLYKNVPNLPANIREVLVKIAPWLALVFGVLTLLAGVGGLGLFTAYSPVVAMYGGVGSSAFLILSSAIAIVQGVIMLIAFPSLNKKKVMGWNLLFWGEILAIVSSVITVSVSSVIGALIGAAIAFYLLFQIKSYYH